MRSTLDELTRELEELEALVASIAPVNSALAEHQNSLVRQYVLIRRRFDYAAFAVALYASFENFIENLVAGYARLESRRVKYAGLPQGLLKKHLFRTAEMLLRGRIGEGRYIGMTELDLVKNLFECLKGVTPYTLNKAAVVAHLRTSEINNLFAAVGIERVCERARGADALLEWYCAAKELDSAPQDGVPPPLIEERIKDLVERRNQITHGGNPVDLLGVDEMHDVLGFVRAFSQSAFAIVVGRYLRDHRATSGESIQLLQRKGDGPYHDGRTVVVQKPAQRLFVGQPVFVLLKATGARWGRIQGIQVDGSAIGSLEPDAAAAGGVGIALDFKCPRGASLVALSVSDDVVWSPPAEPAVPAA